MLNENNKFSRRDFVRLLGMAGAGSFLTACGLTNEENGVQNPDRLNTGSVTTRSTDTAKPEISNPQVTSTATSGETPETKPSDLTYLSIVHGEDAETITNAAIAALGGMEKFVHPGNDVIIKPNICTDYYSYEYAATTNPWVIAALVKMCLASGAKNVRVMDNPFGGSAESAYQRSGIAEAVGQAGGEMEVMNRNKYRIFPIPDGRDLKEWEFYIPIIEADVIINVPIAKTHGLARLTLGGKNMLGVINRPGAMHGNLGQRVADLVSKVKPALTVIDAVRILTRNGPTGGDLNDVKSTNRVIASADIVAADTFASSLFGMVASDISYIRASADMGLGTMDLSSIKMEEFSV